LKFKKSPGKIREEITGNIRKKNWNRQNVKLTRQGEAYAKQDAHSAHKPSRGRPDTPVGLKQNQQNGKVEKKINKRRAPFLGGTRRQLAKTGNFYPSTRGRAKRNRWGVSQKNVRLPERRTDENICEKPRAEKQQGLRIEEVCMD